jgi:hypothetical protein
MKGRIFLSVFSLSVMLCGVNGCLREERPKREEEINRYKLMLRK